MTNILRHSIDALPVKVQFFIHNTTLNLIKSYEQGSIEILGDLYLRIRYVLLVNEGTFGS